MREDFGRVDCGFVLRGCEFAAVILACFDYGIDEWQTAIACGFKVCDEGIDGFADAGVGGEDCVDTASGLVQAFVLSSGTGSTPQIVEIEGAPGAMEVGFHFLYGLFEEILHVCCIAWVAGIGEPTTRVLRLGVFSSNGVKEFVFHRRGIRRN